MSEQQCTCHCGGSMFYRHLHAESCALSRDGEEAPVSVEQALRAENARFRAVLMNMQAAWNNKNEVTSVYVWNERMKAAMADVDAALQPERGRND